jgi:hypothetical protein
VYPEQFRAFSKLSSEFPVDPRPLIPKCAAIPNI